MANSIFIAKLIGPFLIIVGIASISNIEHLKSIVREFMAGPAHLFIAGVIALVTGLVLVNTHNVWVSGWPVIITIIGWLALLGGIFRLVFPAFAVSMGKSMIDKTMFLRGAGLVQIVLGLYLSWQGYLAAS